MNFWTAFGIFLAACVVLVGALSINGKTEAPAGDAHGHGHGHDDHGHGGHGHH